jgi:hypothetical protein
MGAGNVRALQWFNVGTIYTAIGTQAVDKNMIASILSLWQFLNTFALSTSPSIICLPRALLLTTHCDCIGVRATVVCSAFSYAVPLDLQRVCLVDAWAHLVHGVWPVSRWLCLFFRLAGLDKAGTRGERWGIPTLA